MARVKIDIRKQYREQLKMFLSMSNVVRAKIRAMFKKFGKRAERLYLNTGNVNSDLYNDFSSEIYKILTQSARRVITNADLMLTRTRMTKGKEDIDPVFLEYTTSQTAQNVVAISETTRKQIQKEINTGLKTGLSNQQISKNIRNSTAFSAVRATRIARTETHTAMNFGNQKLAGRLGLNRPVKEWVSAMDERTRTWHVSMNGTQVDIKDKFTVPTPVSGGAFVDREMMYAGDPNGGATNVINCRCFVIYHDADDVVDRPTRTTTPILEEREPVIPVPEKQPDVDAINPTSLAKPISGSALTIESGKKIRKELAQRIKQNNSDPRYKIFRDDPSGRKVNKGAGKVTSTLSKYSDRELTELKVIMDELDELADFYNIPRIAGIGGVSTSSHTASMGFGVLNLNSKYYDAGSSNSFLFGWTPSSRQVISKEWLDNNRNSKFAKYKIGESDFSRRTSVRSSRQVNYHGVNDYTVDDDMFQRLQATDNEKALQDLSLAQKRAVAYHEFAHHIHNSFNVGTKTVKRFSKDLSEMVETQIADRQLLGKINREVSNWRRTVELDYAKRGKSILFPSTYSSTNGAEWFAENFSAYQMGFSDVVSPYFTSFFEKEVLSQIR